MPLDLASVGAETPLLEYEYDWKKLVLYALGIGAKREELDYLYEQRGPKVYPSFAVVPSYPALMDLIGKSGGNFAAVVHGGQTVRVFGDMPPKGTLQTRGRIAGIYDLKRFATMVLETTTTCNGEKVFETEWSIIYRDAGGFGGPRPPKTPNVRIPKDTAPAWTFSEKIPNEQALLYRLSGDTNPLHADPKFAADVGFERGPILHGLCSYGYLCRALVLNAAGGDSQRLKSLVAQFRQPVWPGDTLRTDAYPVDDKLAVACYVEGNADPVISGHAEIVPA